MFAKLEDGSYGVCGRKGTKDDVSRKPAVCVLGGRDHLLHFTCTHVLQFRHPLGGRGGDASPFCSLPALSFVLPQAQVRRNSSGALAGEGGSPSEGRASGKRSRSRGGADSSKSKRVKQKQAEQAVRPGSGSGGCIAVPATKAPTTSCSGYPLLAITH